MSSARLAGSALAALTVLVGCASGESAAERVDRCAERFLERTAPAAADVRAYVRRAYCDPFDARGWVHEDGTLAIEAFTEGWEEECATETPDGGSRTVPCDSLVPAGRPRRVDCALLDLVRRADVQTYLAQLTRAIECDDGTRLDDLGAR